MVGEQINSKLWHSTVSFDVGDGDGKNSGSEESDIDLVSEKRDSQAQGVDPRKGWGFRGVHKVLMLVFNEKVYWYSNVILNGSIVFFVGN